LLCHKRYKSWIYQLLFVGLVFTFDAAAQSVQSEFYLVSVSPDDTLVMGVNTSGVFHIWDTLSGNALLQFEGVPNLPLSVAWSPDSRRIAAAGGDSLIRVWCVDISADPSCASATLVAEITGHEDPIVSIAWSSDDRIASSGQLEPRTIRIWDGATYQPLSASGGPFSNHLAWHPSNQRIFSASEWGGVISIAVSSRRTRALSADLPVLSLSLNANGSQIAFGTQEGEVIIIDATSGTEIASFQGFGERVDDLVWSPDNQRIASSMATGAINIWDIATGEVQTISNRKNIAINLQIDWTTTTGLIFGNNLGGITGLGTNQPPEAIAGNDRIIVDENGNGFETVTLNGRASRDDVVVTDYHWSEDGIVLATGLTPQIDLSLGTHHLTLLVIDDDGVTDTDDVTITVNAVN
jgi:WD40 repeat protein